MLISTKQNFEWEKCRDNGKIYQIFDKCHDATNSSALLCSVICSRTLKIGDHVQFNYRDNIHTEEIIELDTKWFIKRVTIDSKNGFGSKIHKQIALKSKTAQEECDNVCQKIKDLSKQLGVTDLTLCIKHFADELANRDAV